MYFLEQLITGFLFKKLITGYTVLANPTPARNGKKGVRGQGLRGGFGPEEGVDVGGG